MGLLPFLSFDILPSRYRCVGVKVLIATVFVFVSYGSESAHSLSVSAVNFRIKSLVVFEHAIEDSQDFVHAQSYGSHLLHSLFNTIQINAANKGIRSDGAQGHHEKYPSRFFASLFAHPKGATTITANLIDWMKPEE